MKTLQGKVRATMRAAKARRGLIIVHTGNGKGKTTAAFGMLARMLAHGRTCAVVQFIKSGNDAVEKLLRRPTLSWHRVGDGFTWDTQDRAADIASARRGWDAAMQMLISGEYDMLILDELNVILKYEYLALDEVLQAFAQRPANLHIVVTGRHAPEALMAAADLVTEMKLVKHPYREQGIKAQAGVEY